MLEMEDMKENAKPLTMYHDGACPLCQAEVLLLKRRSRSGRIRFVDVHDSAFEAAEQGLTRDRALQVMHGRVGEGPLLQGVEVMAAAYERTDLPFMAWLLSRPSIGPLLNWGYRVFAANRKTISRLIGPIALRFAKARWSRTE